MKCQDRDPDLLLFGLGELAPGRHLRVFLHLSRCARCRTRQRELAVLSGRIADALRPPNDGGAGGTGIRVRPADLMRPVLLRLWLALVVSLLVLGGVGVWLLQSHAHSQSIRQEVACRPDLASDKCR
jgi:anti-sigma factor RsiW